MEDRDAKDGLHQLVRTTEWEGSTGLEGMARNVLWAKASKNMALDGQAVGLSLEP